MAQKCLYRFCWCNLAIFAVVSIVPLFLATLLLNALKLLFPPRLYSYTMRFLFQFVHEKIGGYHQVPPKKSSRELIQESTKRLSRSPSLQIEDTFPIIVDGFEAVMRDELTQHFTAAELKQWNLLTRTDMNVQCTSFPVMCIWFLGLIMRYVIILPVRLTFMIIASLWLISSSALTKILPNIKYRKKFHEWTYVYGMDLFVCSFAYVNYHNAENQPKNGSICVTNHTSPLDALIITRRQPFSLTGQQFSDIFGYVQMWFAEFGEHIWFDRSTMSDRRKVVEIMEAHTNDKSKYPILIFPEGTCINNNAIFMFRKGPFEVRDVNIYPAVIVYDQRFADPFWNSSVYSLFHFIVRLMTSWGLFCDVYYLPMQKKLPEESSIEFARRVKALISQKGGFIDLEYDGQLKRKPPSPAFKEKIQQDLANELLKRHPAVNDSSLSSV